MDHSLPGSSVHGDSPGKNTGVGCHALLQEIFLTQLRSPASQVDFLSSEPPGKPKNTGVGSPSLLQGNFLTQELNRGLLHCRQIPYQLSQQGSPKLEVQFSCSVMSDSLQPHEPQHARPPCISPTPRVHPNSCPSSQ